MKNVWADLHPLVEGDIACDLSDYTLVATDDNVIDALKAGLKEAQSLLRVLNMAPAVQCANKTWFLTPWVLEKMDPQNFAYIPATCPVRGEDGDAEVLRDDLAATATQSGIVDSNSTSPVEGEEDILEDGSPDLPVLQVEAEDAISDMLNGEEAQVRCLLLTEKVIPFVEYGGHNIYKSTLVSQLNANPFLS